MTNEQQLLAVALANAIAKAEAAGIQLVTTSTDCEHREVLNPDGIVSYEGNVFVELQLTDDIIED
jgi:hypothetical protein